MHQRGRCPIEGVEPPPPPPPLERDGLLPVPHPELPRSPVCWRLWLGRAWICGIGSLVCDPGLIDWLGRAEKSVLTSIGQVRLGALDIRPMGPIGEKVGVPPPPPPPVLPPPPAPSEGRCPTTTFS